MKLWPLILPAVFLATLLPAAPADEVVIVDDVDAVKTGTWVASSWSAERQGPGYLHDGKKSKGELSITFTASLKASGDYEVRVAYNAGGDRAKNVPVTIRHAGGETVVTLDETRQPAFGKLFEPVGRFHFEAGTPASVTLANAGTSGYVVADAVAFVPVALADAELTAAAPKAEVIRPEHIREFNGIFPHLASFNDQGECGTGAVVPWADRLWFITYSPHMPSGSSDKLYEVAPDLGMTLRPESVGGTPANRMIHRESGQLFIGPYAIGADRTVRAIPPSTMRGRLTGNARHLTDPANKLYYATMEEGFYEVDVHSLRVTELYVDANFTGNKGGDLLPGYHGKGLYSGQGRLIYANNGENSALARQRPDIPSGVLAEWDGTDWRVVLRNQFTEVTGPGGIYGNEHPETDPVWSIGWDHRSLILMLRDGGEWHRFRLPKASHAYDGAHGWNTEWPRIREIGEDDLLMTMHGMFWKFPKGFREGHTGGIEPRSTYLKVVGDFTRWGDKLVLGCDDAAQAEFLNTRKAKGKVAGPAQSQSNLWFIPPGRVDQLGPALGRGAVWLHDEVKAGEWSDAFLLNGFDLASAHLAQDAGRAVTFSFQVDRRGDGQWVDVGASIVPATGYLWRDLADAGKAVWIRVKTDTDCRATAWYELRDRERRTEASSGAILGLSQATDTDRWQGLVRAGKRGQGLQLLASTVRTGIEEPAGYYELNPHLELVKVDDPKQAEWMREHVALPTGVLTLDEASILYTDDEGNRFRLPVANEEYRRHPELLDRQRTSREVCTERDLFQAAGTFFELPARNAGDFAKIRPICSHPFYVQDYCSWRGMMVLTGLNLFDSRLNPNVVRSRDSQAAVWLGAIDDLWSLGKPTGRGGPWRNSPVKAGEPSDPYLLSGYDQRSLTLTHDAAKPVDFTLEVDISGAGDWLACGHFPVAPGKSFTHEFPAAFQAYWARLRTDTDCAATAEFIYR